MKAWLSDALKRYYPASPAEEQREFVLSAARGERVSFQVLCRTTDERVKVTIAASAASPEGMALTIRRVGYVPMPHLNCEVDPAELEGIDYLPGYVPDPLFPETSLVAGTMETNAFWITLRIPKDAVPGRYEIPIALTLNDEPAATLTATLLVHQAVLPVRDFPVTHWFYADALLDWYKLEGFTEEFWRIFGVYVDDVVAHGQDVLYVPTFTPPLDGVKRPTQLLRVRRDGDGYQFDWSLVRRWIRSARERGIRRFEWAHLFTQWGAKYALRIYRDHGGDEVLLWPPETPGTSPLYREFLAQYLTELHRFLQAEDLLECSFFHVSDEPHGEEHLRDYRAAREMLRELAPWMRVMDALSDITFAREGLTDIPIPILDKTMEFVQEGFAPWTYYWGGPRGNYINRQLDTPLWKIRMSGWLFYATGVKGFLNWAYNYWYRSQTRELIDPFTVLDSLVWPRWCYGDGFLVYPGADGPIDSIRWEVFAESLQDYALLQGAGINSADPLLSGITDFASFPREKGWITAHREAILTLLDDRINS